MGKKVGACPFVVLLCVWYVFSGSCGVWADTPESSSAKDVSVDAIDKALEESKKQDVLERGDANVINGTRETLNVPVISWRDMPFRTVKRQTFDYSCGSAAVATLLSYVYEDKTSEGDVFRAMFDAGDQDKIRSQGFSLLDMRNYLTQRGFNAVGYHLSMDTAEKLGAPFIALINRDGYKHFVVVKSVRGRAVLLGDPNKGNVIYSLDDFIRMWDGTSLVVMNKARMARSFAKDVNEWQYARASAMPSMGEHPGLDSVNVPFPNWQIAPINADVVQLGSGANLTATVR